MAKILLPMLSSKIFMVSGLNLCDSMDGCGEHYAKWNKPVRERQMPYDFTHVESNEQNELTSKIETDS